MRRSPARLLARLLVALLGWQDVSPAAESYESHPPIRPLPRPSPAAELTTPAFFVDPVRGEDARSGTQTAPWKTLSHGVAQLKPGDTLYLRGGTYYETVTVRASGTPDRPVIIRGYPGEQAVLDAGHREFFELPAIAWEPAPDGIEGEFRSVRPYAFGGGFGNFGDSMVPFHRYMNFQDLRSRNELYRPALSNRAPDPDGIYAGPGTFRDPQTGRIHIRLAPTTLAGLGENAYRGQTDPRRLPLVISGHDSHRRGS